LKRAHFQLPKPLLDKLCTLKQQNPIYVQKQCYTDANGRVSRIFTICQIPPSVVFVSNMGFGVDKMKTLGKSLKKSYIQDSLKIAQKYA